MLVSCEKPVPEVTTKSQIKVNTYELITKIVRTPILGESYLTPLTHEFTYDSEGHLVSAIETGAGESLSVYEFVREDGKIAKRHGASCADWAVLNENGEAVEFWWDYGKAEKMYDITYGEDGRLSSTTSYSNGVEQGQYSCSWDADGNISGITLTENGVVVSESVATYNSHPNDLNLNLNWMVDGASLGNMDYDLASIGFFGARSAYRIATYYEKWNGGERHITFCYGFDDWGRVTIIRKDVAGSDTEDCIYEIFY
jgi:antitoxin component YwqK of YwqJK toxin-antitoxin module